MSDIVKWGILIAGIAVLIATILLLPFGSFLDIPHLTEGISSIVQIASSALEDVRAFINMWLHPWARTILSGLMIYLFASWVYKIGVKFTAWAFHWIFK